MGVCTAVMMFLADGPVFDVHSDDITQFCSIAGNNWCIGFGVDSSVAAVIGDFAAVVATEEMAGCAGCNVIQHNSRSVKTVPKTTEAKLKFVLREIVYFSNTSPF